MNKKKELCRNFQRGSCQYGARCKFLHSTPQQQQQQQQQQQPSSNPFGFGVQSTNKQFKPFENKWSRFSPLSNAASASAPARPTNTTTAAAPTSSSRQPDNHTCTDPDSCKRLIAQDFEQERPLWKLTCYGHSRNGPCDIVGDTSYEELRAAAYNDAKHGLSLQSIVERERNLLSSKLIDFENLIRNPHTIPSKSSLASHSLFPGASPNAASSAVQNSAPPSVSTFGQLGASLNLGHGTRPSTPSNNAFVQPNNFVSNSSQPLGADGVRPYSPSNYTFGQSNMSSIFGQNSSTYGMNLSSANPGSFGSQLPNQTFGSSMSTVIPAFGSSGMSTQNSSVSSALSLQNIHSSSVPFPMISNGPNSVSGAIMQEKTNASSVIYVKRENISGSASIWLKEKWTLGEIPEEAPPDEFVF